MNEYKSYWEYQERYSRFSRRTQARRLRLRYFLAWMLAACVIFSVFLAFYIPMKKADAAREKAKVRALVFADQKLPEVIARIETHKIVATNSLPVLKSANEAILKGDKHLAVSELRKVLATPDIEIRAQLLAWNALRDLGEKPPAKDNFNIHGVVVELPMNNGLDTITAYEDGRVCYMDQTNGILTWDSVDDSIRAICRQVIADAKPLIGRAPFVTEKKTIAAGHCRITMLTFAGNRAIDCKMDTPLPVVTECINLTKVIQKETRNACRKDKAPPREAIPAGSASNTNILH